jgi:hypothetical protein
MSRDARNGTTLTTGTWMMRRFSKGVVAVVAAIAGLAVASSAEDQEIQLTGPLAGAPAVRQLRLHREGRFELAPSVSFTLLDQYERTIMPGGTLSYYFTDWIGVSVWGGFGITYTTNLSDELQQKAIDDRNCTANPTAKACRLTQVNLTRGKLENDQLGKIGWAVAPQVTVIPFRGKLALFSSLFVDTDVNIFAGPAFVGVKERAACGADDNGNPLPIPCNKYPDAFKTNDRVAIAPTFGLGVNFYPASFVGFGVAFRALPFSWNTSGFDNHGGGANGDFPDNNVNGKDSEFHFNSLLTVNLAVQFPTTIKLSK